jgi:hypothetical protein
MFFVWLSLLVFGHSLSLKKLNPASLFGGVFLSKVSCELKRIIVILELNGTSHWELVT